MSDTSLIVCPRDTLTPTIAAKAQALIDDALEGCALIGAITTQEQNDAAVIAVSQVTALIRLIEKSHKGAKEPFLKVCQALDKTRREMLLELEAEELRVNTNCGNFLAEQENIRREKERERQRKLDLIERERLEEDRRTLEESERVERERQAEIRRKEEDLLEDQRRLEAEASKAKSKKTREEAMARAKIIEGERISTALRAAEETKQLRTQLELASRDRLELSMQAVEAVGPQLELVKTAGQRVKVEFVFEVVDIWKLVRARPDLVNVTPRTMDINDLIDK